MPETVGLRRDWEKRGAFYFARGLLGRMGGGVVVPANRIRLIPRAIPIEWIECVMHTLRPRGFMPVNFKGNHSTVEK
jgi:hypothetical protein